MRTYVGAASYEHFIGWCKDYEKDPRVDEVYYLHRTQQLDGLNPKECQFILYPTFWEREDASELLHEINRMEKIRDSRKN